MPNTVNNIDFAIFTALQQEQEYYHELLSGYHSQVYQVNAYKFKIYHYKNKKILIVRSGIGSIFTASVLTFVYFHFKPKFAFLSGTAGGIKPELKINDVIIVENAFEAELYHIHEKVKNTAFANCLKAPFTDSHIPDKYSASEELLAIAKQIQYPSLTTYFGTVVSSDEFPLPKELFRKIKDNSVYSIDMETAAFYQTGWLFKFPVIGVRGISNFVNQSDVIQDVQYLDIKKSSKMASSVIFEIVNRLI